MPTTSPPSLRSLMLLLFFSVHHLGDVDAASSKCTAINTIAAYTNAPTTAEKLDLSGKGLCYIPNGAFDRFTALTELSLSHNQLATALGVGLFDKNTALTRLSLSGNRLTVLDVGLFDKNTALEWLHLYENRLSALDVGLFEKNTALKQLWLYENQLTAVDVSLFDINTALEQLYLDENRLAVLDVGLFDKNTALQTLSLFANQLTALDVGLFDKNTALVGMRLDSNRLTALDVGLFDKNTALEFLSLDSNQLAALNVGLLDKNTALEYLSLNSNQFTTLDAGLFDNNTALIELYLYNNQLTALDGSLFYETTALTILDLSSNQMTSLDVGLLDKKAALEYLFVRNNAISHLSINLTQASTHLKIDASGNTRLRSFKSTSGVLEGLSLRGCTNLKKVIGSIKVLDISETAVNFGDPGSINCSNAGSQILFAQNLQKKISSATAPKVIEQCVWSKDRTLLDLAGSLTKHAPLSALQNVLSIKFMAVFNFRTLLLGDDSAVQCNQSPLVVPLTDVDKDLADTKQQILVLRFKCACVANYHHDERSDTCEPNLPFLATPGGIALVTVAALLPLMILLAVSGWRLFRRRFSRLKFDLGTTERLLGEAQSDVLALRKAWEIPDADIRLVTRIDGSSPGAFGEVWRADWDGVTVAVKVLRLSIMELDTSTREEFDKEAEFLMRARHSNVVRFFGAGVEASGAPFLVLELVGRGSLRSLLRGDAEAPAEAKTVKAQEHPLSRALQLRLALDVARGMQYIHGLHMLHRDLKSGNVLVTNTWRAKVADFGSMGSILGNQPPQSRHGADAAAWSEMPLTASTRFGDSREASHAGSLTLTRGVGTPLYMSPEVLRGDKYGQGADVWSYSVLIWELVHAQTPDLLKQEGDVGRGPMLGRLLRQLERGARLKMGLGTPRWARRVFSECSAAAPEARPSFATIVELFEAETGHVEVEVDSREPTSSAIHTLDGGRCV